MKQTPHSFRRKDVDGLRGLAIAGVVAFHFFPTVLRGGYAGVDIFFVISGFVISTLLRQALDDGHFTFAHFYNRRIRRLLPALLLVLGSCLLLGWFTLLFNEYRQLAKHAAGGLTFISNFLYWNEAGYFDQSGQFKPLLHLWSLGIEEQFYLACPLLFWIAHRLQIRSIWLILPITAASFFWYQRLLSPDSVAAFFSPLGRAWEISAGAIVAEILSRRPRFGRNTAHFLSVLGLVLVFYALATTTHVAVAVLGAVALILAREDGFANRLVLSNPAVVTLGLISYSLYLWHWPIRSFSQILLPEWQSVSFQLGYIALAITLAAATYKFLEKPVLSATWDNPMRFLRPVGGASALVVLFSLAVFFEQITSPLQKGSEALAKYDFLNGKTEGDFFNSHVCHLFSGRFDDPHRAGCTVREFPERPTVMLVGDSFGGYLSLGLRPYLKERRINFIQSTMVWCTPFDETHFDARCAENSKFVMRKVQEIRPDILMVFVNYNHWAGQNLPTSFSSYLAAKLNQMAISASRVIVFGQMPEWHGGLPNVVGRAYTSKRKPIPLYIREGLVPKPDADAELLAQPLLPKNLEFVSMKQFLCRGEGCLTTVPSDKGLSLIAFDYAHLTDTGAEYVTKKVVAPLLVNRQLSSAVRAAP
jgi:peptidoglycan/LPS O-acetylase OafA/YrhL